MQNLMHYPLWTAMVTPFKKDLSIDFDSLKNLLHAQEKAGNGILILGSTGEALSLSMEEKKQILEFTCSLNLKAPIMVGVGGIHLESTLAWIDICEKYPIQSYLFVTPLYAKPGDNGQYEWFKSLLDRASHPCMLYNIPGRTGVSLSVKAAIKLQDHKNFWSVKEASCRKDDFERFVHLLPKQHIFSGDDALFPDYCLIGAKGLVSVASNPWPEEVHKLVKLCLGQENYDFYDWNRVAQSLFLASNPVPVKGLMHIKGQITTPHMRPPLHQEDLEGTMKQELQLSDLVIKRWKEKKS